MVLDSEYSDQYEEDLFALICSAYPHSWAYTEYDPDSDDTWSLDGKQFNLT